jgi:hypothetical protein
MAKARVTAPGLNMHLAPGSERIVHALTQGDEVTVIKSEQHSKLWLFVWHEGHEGDEAHHYGWVCADFVEVLAPKVSPYHPKPLEQLAPEPLPFGLWLAGTAVVLAIVALVVGALLK